MDWFVDEVLKLEKKMDFSFKNSKKDTIMRQEDAEVFKFNDICRFCEKEIESDKVRRHCHSSGKYTGTAHKIFKMNVL